MKIVWTEHALACLAEIEDFIAQDDPAAAVLLLEKLIARTDILQNHPHAGRRVPEKLPSETRGGNPSLFSPAPLSVRQISPLPGPSGS